MRADTIIRLVLPGVQQPSPNWVASRLQAIAESRWGISLSLDPALEAGTGTQILLSASFVLHDDPPWDYFRNLTDSGYPVFFEESRSGVVLAAAFPTNADPTMAIAWARYLSHPSPGVPAGRPVLPRGSWVLRESGNVSDAGLQTNWRTRDDSRSSRNLPALNQLILELQLLSGRPEHIANELADCRSRSRVPWLVNTLLNEAEYRSRTVHLQSAAPELHLATTSACNIECTFCSYTHGNAIFRYLDLDSLLRLDLFSWIETLRLSSGLGEPTLNPHLPAILEHLGTNYPHLQLNLFTNGLAWRRPGLIDSFRHLSWINVSLNAATDSTWQQLCQKDGFARVRANLAQLRASREATRRCLPLVHGSIVLNRENIAELPQLPSLCAELGIARLTAIPFFALGYEDADKLNGNSSLASCGDEYGNVFDETVEAASRAGVSLEAPLPQARTRVSFGVQSRQDYDFAGVRRAGIRIERLLPEPVAGGVACPSLWRLSAIAATSRTHRRHDSPGFLYPCLGPLASHDFSEELSIDYSSREQYLSAWNSPRYQRLRTGQSRRGLSLTCDACGESDSRNPDSFALFLRLRTEESPTGLVQIQTAG